MMKQPDEPTEDRSEFMLPEDLIGRDDSPTIGWIIATVLGGAMAAGVIFLATYNWVTLEIFP
jgi:hypothetical protein